LEYIYGEKRRWVLYLQILWFVLKAPLDHEELFVSARSDTWMDEHTESWFLRWDVQARQTLLWQVKCGYTMGQ
jgi:hypothetical protein